MLEAGSPAPSFSVPDQDGTNVSLSDFAGKWVVLWWYPAASTPGWTIEGSGFRDRAREFEEAGAVILGISFDAPEKNKAFAETENFPYRLLSDVDRTVAEAYSTTYPADSDWASVARRLTFLIGPDGVVRKVYKVKDVASHPGDVLADIASSAGH